MNKLVQLKDNGKITPNVFVGVDVHNLLYEDNSGYNAKYYTATQDCFMTITGWGEGDVRIDDVTLFHTYNSQSPYMTMYSCMLKKGQEVHYGDYGRNSENLKIYGLKYL